MMTSATPTKKSNRMNPAPARPMLPDPSTRSDSAAPQTQHFHHRADNRTKSVDRCLVGVEVVLAYKCLNRHGREEVNEIGGRNLAPTREADASNNAKNIH